MASIYCRQLVSWLQRLAARGPKLVKSKMKSGPGAVACQSEACKRPFAIEKAMTHGQQPLLRQAVAI